MSRQLDNDDEVIAFLRIALDGIKESLLRRLSVFNNFQLVRNDYLPRSTTTKRGIGQRSLSRKKEREEEHENENRQEREEGESLSGDLHLSEIDQIGNGLKSQTSSQECLECLTLTVQRVDWGFTRFRQGSLYDYIAFISFKGK